MIGDKNLVNAENIAKIMNEAGFDAEALPFDISCKESILHFIQAGKKYGEISTLINAAGVSPITSINRNYFKRESLWNSFFIRRSRKSN